MKLNIGCGWRDFGREWVHIDGGDYKHLNSSDVFVRAYDKHSVDLIYSSHMIEYFDREEVIDLLKCWKRVLKPDGTLRVAVPDFGIISSLYCNKKYSLEKFLGLLYGKMTMVDERIYHKTTYDFQNLKKILEDAGFKNVQRYDWRKTDHAEFDDHSQAYLPHMDKENGVLISLNVECTSEF